MSQKRKIRRGPAKRKILLGSGDDMQHVGGSDARAAMTLSMSPAARAAGDGDGVGGHGLKARTAGHREELLTCGLFRRLQPIKSQSSIEERTDGVKVA